MRLADIDLGGFDAESDDRLGEYFVETPYVREALSGKRTLFLGRKGSGKSALFRQLPELYGQSGRDVLAIPVTPDQYAWAALREYQEVGLLPEAAHTNAWKLTLAIQIASRIAVHERHWAPEAADAVRVLSQFLKENYGNENIDLKNAATKLLSGLKSFNLSAFGFGLGFAKTDGDDARRLLTPAVIDRLFELISACVIELGAVVLIDRLDDSWDGSPHSRTLLIGLLKASKDLNSRFRAGSNDTGLRLLVFLRSDIYNTLQFDDKDKHRPLEQPITWTEDELRKLVLARLPKEATLEAIFEPGQMRGRISPFSYMVKRTMLRPREILQFLAECIRKSAQDATYVSRDDIRSAEKQYSRWKVEDLKQEFSKAIPYFSDTLECLRQEYHRYDSIPELEELIRRKRPQLADDRGTRALVEMLFDASAVGVRLRSSGAIRFKSEDSELALPSEAAIYVHQSLHDGLNIVERRGDSESQEDEDSATEMD